jgi:hypothetical protein
VFAATIGSDQNEEPYGDFMEFLHFHLLWSHDLSLVNLTKTGLHLQACMLRGGT